MFAGHLALAALGIGERDYLFQGDADVQNYEHMAPIERLLVAATREQGVHHAKLAQPGRDNETLMTTRAVIQVFHALGLPWVPPAVQQLAHDVFMALAPDKWLTCGMYLVTGAIARSRPFASGYLDATTQALWTVGAPECGWRRVRHVACPVTCRDARNTSQKDALMLSSIAMYLHSVVMLGKPPHLWSLDDISQLNRVLPRLCHIPVIEDTEGPVAIHRIESDRIIPSVNVLSETEIVDLAAVASILADQGIKP